MKFQYLTILILLVSCQDEPESLFDQSFTEGTLRIDYFHTGDADTESVELDEMYNYDHWAGSKTNLIDQLDYGSYYHKVYNADQQLIYSRGFDSYFKEYQVSSPALDGVVKQFHESAIIPFPKERVIFALEKRKKDGTYQEVFRQEIDPAKAKRPNQDKEITVLTSQNSGDPHLKADMCHPRRWIYNRGAAKI